MGRDDSYGQTWECEAECDKETGAAIRVVLETGEAWWFPRSVVCDESEVKDLGDEGTLVVQRWFAEKEGLA